MQNDEITDAYSVGYFFAITPDGTGSEKCHLKNKRPGFVPDRYLTEIDRRVAEEIRKMGQLFALATANAVMGTNHVA